MLHEIECPPESSAKCRILDSIQNGCWRAWWQCFSALEFPEQKRQELVLSFFSSTSLTNNVGKGKVCNLILMTVILQYFNSQHWKHYFGWVGCRSEMSFAIEYLPLETSDRGVAFSLSFVELSSFEIRRSCGYHLGQGWLFGWEFWG